jgi:3-methyladenine DNA glycosylase AlkD
MAADLVLIEGIRGALAASGDPERAVGQQRYMKSEMPYRGVTSPQLRKLLRPILAACPPVDRHAWEDTVRVLWDRAAYREERYAAIALARHRSARPWQDPRALDLYRHLVVTGAWWDLVDEIASHLVGDILAVHRAEATPLLRRWMVDEDPWLRRTAILSQIRHRGETDTGLLHDAIDANVDDPSFWLRKAIGWALRSHAYTDPAWVRAEVAAYGDRMSGLSRREALKHLGPAAAGPG